MMYTHSVRLLVKRKRLNTCNIINMNAINMYAINTQCTNQSISLPV